MDNIRQLISLNGPDWRLAESSLRAPDVTEIERIEVDSLAASVPGEVRLDLMRAGRLTGDLFYGCNNEAGRWVEKRDWWYWRDFDWVIRPDQRAWLRLHGADYVT